MQFNFARYKSNISKLEDDYNLTRFIFAICNHLNILFYNFHLFESLWYKQESCITTVNRMTECIESRWHIHRMDYINLAFLLWLSWCLCVLREWENVMWQLDGKHWLMDNINSQIKWPPTQITASASVRDKLNKLCYTSSFLLQYSLRPISVLTLKIDFKLALTSHQWCWSG